MDSSSESNSFNGTKIREIVASVVVVVLFVLMGIQLGWLDRPWHWIDHRPGQTQVIAAILLLIINLIIVAFSFRVLGFNRSVLDENKRMVDEMREDRLTRDRPIILARFVDRRSEGGENKSISHNERNSGRSPATNVHLEFDGKLFDRRDVDISQNPVLQDGIAPINPSESYKIDLHGDTLINQLIQTSPAFTPGQETIDSKPLRHRCTVKYTDPMTGRIYEESYVPDMNTSILGWTVDRSA